MSTPAIHKDIFCNGIDSIMRVGGYFERTDDENGEEFINDVFYSFVSASILVAHKKIKEEELNKILRGVAILKDSHSSSLTIASFVFAASLLLKELAVTKKEFDSDDLVAVVLEIEKKELPINASSALAYMDCVRSRKVSG